MPEKKRVLVVDDAVLPWGSFPTSSVGYRGFFSSNDLIDRYGGAVSTAVPIGQSRDVSITWAATLEEFEWEVANREFDRFVVDLTFPVSMSGAFTAGDISQMLTLEVVWETDRSAAAVAELMYAARPLTVAREIQDGVRMDPERGRKCNGVMAVQELARRDLLNITTVFTSDIGHARAPLCVLLSQGWLPEGLVGEMWRRREEYEKAKVDFFGEFWGISADHRLAVGPKTGGNFRQLLSQIGFPINNK